MTSWLYVVVLQNHLIRIEIGPIRKLSCRCLLLGIISSSKSKSKLHYDRQSVGQFILGSCPSLSRWPDATFICATITFFIFHVGHPLWREDGSVICSAITQVQFQITLRQTVCRPVCLGGYIQSLINIQTNFFTTLQNTLFTLHRRWHNHVTYGIL
jgi:hypothetical protein